ncbi:hypothetical protein GALMADRAFT_256057 [Galerina marginata CBS 339.88]|uniref:Uncharacterized protein n=1 Tax=Galerina marginata (strain CBS 339.88) TaxID=685588 RepID=A0A067SQZ8_GALM3|nr:hypothetical protein GALMADRAFT_256057 [Galerina marginata CBS 339.88]
MSVTVTIPEGLQYVAGAVLFTVVVIQGLSQTVSRYRKHAGIPYPQMYAEKAEVEKSRDALLFNCAQRAHQNMLEQIPLFYATTVISGLKYPIPTAAAAVVWNISRITYARGYLTGDPNNRTSLVYHCGTLCIAGIVVSAFVATGGWILSGLNV